MLRVALTGGIGTGKSVVLGCLRDLGVPVIEADAVAHSEMAPGTPAFAAIAARFGQRVVTATGEIDRRRLAALVFSDDEARVDLERILHPAVYRAIDAWLAVQAAGRQALAVAEIPLLFETGREGDFDRVVVTICDEGEQVRRIVARGGDPSDARLRIAAQWPIEEKARRADVVILTDGSLDDTRIRTQAALRELRSEPTGGRA